MTEAEARKVISAYREYDEETDSEYGFRILECIEQSESGFLFKCQPDECTETCILAVYPGGLVLTPPT